MKENLNPKPNSLKEEKQKSESDKSIAKNNDQTYDLSDVGDAALLAVLSEAQEDSGSEQSKDQNDGKSKDQNDGGDNCRNDDIDPGKVASLLSLALKLLSGELPEERLLHLMDAAKALEAIEEARKEGEVAGRNAVIEERLRPVEIGAPDLNGAPAPNRPRKASIFDLARDAR
ncbi:MAG: hypothetical protein K2M31_05110 [Muribaculaceae bacterium]|nr:hypothetical protein [Muribaculaceae bacterium]